MPAWRTPAGQISFQQAGLTGQYLQLPCGRCLGCRASQAKAWALRCRLELQEHASAVFTTLTYSDDNLPPTLQKRHLQLYLKRLRRSTDRAIRFFASGEYGENTNRPHYHAILYGLGPDDHDTIETTWGYGHARSYPVSPRAIHYVAGYVNKKIHFREERTLVEQVDPNTGEVYRWQPPFIQMSRRPGIGSHARAWPESWRSFAVMDGYKMPVPRFYHEAWKAQATPQQQEELEREKIELALKRDTRPERLAAAEQRAIRQQELQGLRRNL